MRFFGPAVILWLASLSGASAEAPEGWRLDFGAGPTEPGYTAAGLETFSNTSGFGWLGSTAALQLRDRGAPDALRRDYVYGNAPATFRLRVRTGTYRLTMEMGDTLFGNHVERISVAEQTLPVVRTAAGEFATLTAMVRTTDGMLDIRFDSPDNNWVVNALTLDRVDGSPTSLEPPHMQKKAYSQPEDGPAGDTWGDVMGWPDPIAPLVARYRADLASASSIRPTALTRADYLRLITGEVDFFKGHQDAQGAIIDPYHKVEWQYSTPCYALAAATLVELAGRADLLESATKAMDWAVTGLATKNAANHHEDFYPPMLAHALPLLKRHVTLEKAAAWENQIRDFDPYATYFARPGQGNWNVVALSGEYLFHTLGLRDDLKFVHESVAAEGKNFRSPLGLFLEGPMPYDHFPRAWAADMMAHGYNGPNASKLAEVLRRGSLTSLFMQGPNGELPVGGRSSQHQWNEAQQCMTYEIFAARALRDGDRQMAAAFKRAAHLSLASMFRWVRPSGEMWPVKNYFDPARTIGWEKYTWHSQYNLLPTAMLAIAYKHAGATEGVTEIPAPTDVGGYAIQIDPYLRKVLANAGGLYIQIETGADPTYDATGLVRVQRTGFPPQMGPSDSLTSTPKYVVPEGPTTDAAIGAAWKAPDGTWWRLAQCNANRISAARLVNVSATPERVSFDLTYEGRLNGPEKVVERYTVTPDAVTLTTELPGYDGPMRYVWPVLADNGREKTAIAVRDGVVRVTLNGDTQTYNPVGASSVRVGDALYAYRNGYARLAVAEFPQGSPITLRIEPKVGGHGQ